ncbi:MAG: hypothetical protein IT307_05405 [Chloroflexi bacterium]|nr:hypothetical protein [Chloroflexota bacterium]
MGYDPVLAAAPAPAALPRTGTGPDERPVLALLGGGLPAMGARLRRCP